MIGVDAAFTKVVGEFPSLKKRVLTAIFNHHNRVHVDRMVEIMHCVQNV